MTVHVLGQGLEAYDSVIVMVREPSAAVTFPVVEGKIDGRIPGVSLQSGHFLLAFLDANGDGACTDPVEPAGGIAATSFDPLSVEMTFELTREALRATCATTKF
jgi:hypothetical protein